MRYPHLPPVGALHVPELHFLPSPNRSSRHGRPLRLVFTHVWGGGTFEGTVGWLRKPDSAPGANDGSGASAHVVYAGELGPDAGAAAQLVPWAEKAWTECELNSVGVSFETADAIWQGHDPEGFARLARMHALVLKLHGLPVRWVRADGIVAGSSGHTRHADAGALGCGHLYCPTRDLDLYGQFHERVVAEYRHGGFRSSWGR